METFRLNNGVEMPVIGMGVFRMGDNSETRKAIGSALEMGYRHIDTASYYDNEKAVGEAVRDSGIAREDIFITTKIWNDDQRSDRVVQALEESLRKLGTEYVDLYLIHWPVKDKFRETWKVFENLYHSGKARAIGVSNFKVHHLEALKEVSGLIPAVNQIELHPYLIQEEEVNYGKENGIRTEAWSPFSAGKTDIFEEPILKEIAADYGKSPAQVILRWDYQRGVITIPKSSHKARLAENLHIFDFELTEKDIFRINSLNKNMRTGADPDHFNF